MNISDEMDNCKQNKFKHCLEYREGWW